MLHRQLSGVILWWVPCADARTVFDTLCEIVEENIRLYEKEGRPLPAPMSGKEFVNAMQGMA